MRILSTRDSFLITRLFIARALARRARLRADLLEEGARCGAGSGIQLTVETLPFDSSQNPDLLAPRPAEPRKKTDETLSLETLKKNPALLWGSVGGAVPIPAPQDLPKRLSLSESG